VSNGQTYAPSSVTQPTITSTIGGARDSTGSGTAHNNLQPYITLNFIIKY
jgi:microcystin-dependent protein